MTAGLARSSGPAGLSRRRTLRFAAGPPSSDNSKKRYAAGRSPSGPQLSPDNSKKPNPAATRVAWPLDERSVPSADPQREAKSPSKKPRFAAPVNQARADAGRPHGARPKGRGWKSEGGAAGGHVVPPRSVKIFVRPLARR